jgi:plasmid stabilization system protein ParE
MTYTVSLTREAEQDLERLFEHVLERELFSPTGDPALAQRALDTIRDGFAVLEKFPFTCRKAPQANSPFIRELLISFGKSGYVALFEIVDAQTVVVGAVRHQREDDYR